MNEERKEQTKTAEVIVLPRPMAAQMFVEFVRRCEQQARDPHSDIPR